MNVCKMRERQKLREPASCRIISQSSVHDPAGRVMIESRPGSELGLTTRVMWEVDEGAVPCCQIHRDSQISLSSAAVTSYY